MHERLLRCAAVVSMTLVLCLGGSSVYADAIGDIIESSQESPQEASQAAPLPTKKEEKNTAALPRNTRLPTIVIDPGHGGKDTGAIGHRQVREKDVVLQIAKKLAKALRAKTGARIIMTRDQDRFITLEERDQIAIAEKADLFISIHANAASRQEAAGIEIYYLNNATDEASERLAKRENRSSRKSRSAEEAILSDIVLNDNTVYSRMLAERLRDAFKQKMAKAYSIERLEIKSALFYVLVGSKAPSILLETGFITNPDEAQRLTQAEYQERLVNAVSKGVDEYFKMLKTEKWAM